MLTLLSEPQVRMFHEAGYWRDDTVYSLVAAHAGATPDKPAIRESERVIGYRELVDAADGLAAGLHRRGVRRGQRVAVWLPSRIETAVAALACSRNGYVCCPSLHRDHTVGEIIALLKRMRAAALIAQPGYGADVGRRDIFGAAAEVESLRLVVRLEPPRTVPVLPGFRPAGNPHAGNPPAKRDPDTVVYLAFTSGTTGQPKGVLHSDNTLLAATRAMAADWQLDQNMIIYSLSPLSHNLGWGAMVMTMTGGGEFVIHDLSRGASLVDRLLSTRTTFMFGVPTHAIDLLAEMERRGLRELGAVRGFRVSGAAIPPVVARGLLDHGVTPQSGYGMTEAGSHHYTRPGIDPELIIGSSGTACAGYEVAIFSPSDPGIQAAPRRDRPDRRSRRLTDARLLR